MQQNYIFEIRTICKSGTADQLKNLFTRVGTPLLNYIIQNDGSTLLHIAVNHNNIDVVKYLIQMGADVNIAQFDGTTPLHIAAEAGNVKIVELLLRANANYTAKINNQGESFTPLEIACTLGHLNVVTTFLIHSLEQDLENVCKKGSVDDLKTIIQNSQILAQIYGSQRLASISNHYTFPSTTTPLHIAAFNGNIEIVRYLIEAKIDVNYTQKDGTTALHLAAEAGHFNIVNLLLENGADVNHQLVDKSYKLFTPLKLASTRLQSLLVDLTTIKTHSVKIKELTKIVEKLAQLQTELNKSRVMGNDARDLEEIIESEPFNEGLLNTPTGPSSNRSFSPMTLFKQIDNFTELFTEKRTRFETETDSEKTQLEKRNKN